MNSFLIAYDIFDIKRLPKVKRVAYSFSLGGQRSALEAPLSHSFMKELISQLLNLTKDEDKIKVEQQSIPFKFIDLLVLNHRVTLSTNDILKLTKEEISILIVSYANDNLSLIASANTKNAEIKLAQYHSHARNLEFAKYFISQKIETHAKQLAIHEITLEQTQEQLQLQNVTSIDEIMGIEGAFMSMNSI